MKKRIFQTVFALVAAFIVTAAAATGVSAYTYGQWDNYSVPGVKSVTYLKTKPGSAQTLSNQQVGTYDYYYFSVNAQLGVDAGYTQVYDKTRIGKDESKSFNLSNTVDAGKKLELVLEAACGTDSVCYQYLHSQ